MAKFNIPIIFYGGQSGKGGKKVAANVKTFAESQDQKGFDMDPLEGKKFENAYLGGKQVKEYLMKAFL